MRLGKPNVSILKLNNELLNMNLIVTFFEIKFLKSFHELIKLVEPTIFKKFDVRFADIEVRKTCLPAAIKSIKYGAHDSRISKLCCMS